MSVCGSKETRSIYIVVICVGFYENLELLLTTMIIMVVTSAYKT